MGLTPLCTNDVAVKQDGSSGTISAILCKRWSCEHCRETNRRRVIREGIAGKPQAMLTLTVSSTQYPDEAEAAAALKRGLRLLRLKLERHPRLKNFQFMAIFEAHLSGAPHLHLLVRGSYLPWAWLRKHWEDITGSTHIDIRKIKGSKDAARYVAKYLGKDLHAFEGCKRYWRSKGYAPASIDNDDETSVKEKWTKQLGNFPKIADLLEDHGWTVRTMRNHRLEYDRPEDDYRSPQFFIHWSAVMKDEEKYEFLLGEGGLA